MKYHKNDEVCLKEDKNEEVFVVIKKSGTSKGPIRQFSECDVYEVTDSRNRKWQFREDSLKPKNKN